MFRKTIITISSISLPVGVFAQFDPSTATTLFDSIRDVINTRLIPVFIALALMYTIYSVVQFIAAQDDTQKREEKKQQIFWGIIGLFVITSIWGLVAVVGNSFGLFAGGNLLGR
jgi:hypothetical protein